MTVDPNKPIDSMTSGDDSEHVWDTRRAQTLLRYYERRIERLEDKLDSQHELMKAVIQLRESLANHAGAKNAWDNFTVILRLVDPQSKHYLDKLI
jgi:hypothetical protein